MKFTKIRLVGASNIDLPLAGDMVPGSFILKGVDGLGPPPVSVNMGSNTSDGWIYQNRKAQNRSVSIDIQLRPDWESGQRASDLRSILYGLLTPKYGQLVKLELWNNATLVAQTQGHISNLQPSIFSRETVVQVVLECTSAYLDHPNLISVIPTESIVQSSTLFTINNIGDAPSGFKFAITLVTGFTGDLIITDNAAGVGEFIKVHDTFAAGDIFTVDTRPFSRGVWKTPSGTTQLNSLLNNIDGASTWLQLYQGDNILHINNVSFDWVNPGFGYTPRYWGV